MPVHDWSRVDAKLFHDFQQTWTIGVRNALNGGLLPKDYSAQMEQRAEVVPDVLALDEISAARAKRIAIRHQLGKLVSVVDVLSPGNKSSRRALREFVDQIVGFLARAFTSSWSICFHHQSVILMGFIRRFGVRLTTARFDFRRRRH